MLFLTVLGWALLAVLLLLLFFLLFPITAEVCGEEAFTVSVGYGPLRLRVFPVPRWMDAPPKRNALKAEAAPPPKTARAPAQSQAAPGNERAAAAKSGSVGLQRRSEQVLAAVKTLPKPLLQLCRHIRIRKVRLFLPAKGRDAAATALLYGREQAAAHTALAALSRVFNVQVQRIWVEPVFAESERRKPAWSCQIKARLGIIGLITIRAFLDFKKAQVLR